MKLLHLTPELPYAPGGTGGATRQFELLRRLAARGHDVAVVAPVGPGQRQGAQSLAAAGIALHAPVRPSSRVAETLRALAERPVLAPRAAWRPVTAWQVDVFWTRLRRYARAAIAGRQPDVIVVEHDWAAAWRADLPPDVPAALTLQNLSWRYYEARAEVATGVERALLRAEARRYARHDRRELGRYDLLITMSDADLEPLEALVPVRAIAIPNGVDTAARRTGPSPAGPPTVLFTGTLDYPPNLEALRWLLDDIWPRIRRAVPDARLDVVGRNPPAEAVAAAGEGVTFAGFVPSIDEWFARAHVVVAPLRSGAGTKLKVLDGLASGRPVVATPVAVEGIVARDGDELVVAADAGGFAGATVRLLRDPAARERIGAAGRALAERRYDWQGLAARLEAALGSLA